MDMDSPRGGRGRASLPTLDVGELRVLTYNVWFGETNQKERWLALMKIVRDVDPHVVCFQEATSRFLDVILEIDWVRSDFVVSHTTVDDWQDYRVALLVRKSVAPDQIIEHELVSRLERTLLSASINFNGQKVVIATAHLESNRKNSEYRAQQISQVEALLVPPLVENRAPEQVVSPGDCNARCQSTYDEASLVVFAGDFNFCSSWPHEQSHLDDRWHDSWRMRDGPGFTYDTTVNYYAKSDQLGIPKQVRYDRVLYLNRSRAWQWHCTECRILGNRPVTSPLSEPLAVGQDCTGSQIFPSDHFGLLSRLEPSQVTMARTMSCD